MASARSEAGLVVRTGDRFLFVADCSCRLERDTKINLLPVTDAALHATGIVGCCANLPGVHLEWIIVLRALHPGRCKTRSDFESFCRRYAQHRFSQIRFELVEKPVHQFPAECRGRDIQ